MSGGALTNTLGVTRVRCNDGETIATRGTLRVEGGTVTDRLALRTTEVVDIEQARVRIDVTIDGEDLTAFNPTGWSTADDVYITATEDGARIAGLAYAVVTERKQIVIAGSHAVELNNYLLAEDNPDYADPGYIQSRPRVLSPGDGARLVLDPVTQRWLVNDGMFSGQYITHDNELITHDGGSITTF